MTRLRLFSLATVFLLVVAIACSSDDSPSTSVPAAPEPAKTEPRPDEYVLIKGPLSEDGIQAIFATADLGIGDHRVGFVLQSQQSLVRAPAATVVSRFFAEGDSQGQVRETALAVFRPWPYGTRGIYTTQLTFDAPGRWRIDISTLDPDGSRRSAQLSFDVAETTEAPDVGSPAILSVNKTVGDVEKISQLTTGSLQDSDLYQLTIADAVKTGLPTVVVMASPAFCTNAVCGPQVEVLQELKDKYMGEANFIHIDFYDNPEEIQGDLDRARLSPTVLEWRLPSTEWSFIIDRNSNIAARFESFATFEELEQALRRVF